ncbi:hypothetical protein TEA_004469 [Camellia sinensis var. sinensis]|uniref:26S proteasome non-ATPase regulatory subunit 3 N-terminal TPR repeats domain-containing protein n=1 Tax=Camellia sinensis var. sinensis TaxID=542762 RepID=A0A4S4CWI2_CAMSN|nr:hypothetical protein TEA_004469 [Camellia sinensis var. sinensis]
MRSDVYRELGNRNSVFRRIVLEQSKYPKMISRFSAKMTQDVEMKEQAAPSNSVSSTGPSALQQLKEIASLIETGAYAREVRRIVRAIRLTIALRQKLKASVLSAFLNFVLVPGSEVHSRLSSYLPKDTQNYLQHWEWTASVVMAQEEENAQVHGLSLVLNSNAFLGSYISIVVYM